MLYTTPIPSHPQVLFTLYTHFTGDHPVALTACTLPAYTFSVTSFSTIFFIKIVKPSEGAAFDYFHHYLTYMPKLP